MYPPTCKADGYCWSIRKQSLSGELPDRVLGEPRDVGVGTLLVGKYVTASSSCTALYTEEAERWGNGYAMQCLIVLRLCTFESSKILELVS